MPSWPLIASLPASVTPVDSAATSITGYIVGFGPLGIAVLALAWLSWKGWRLMSPAREAEIRAAARADARADLERENARLITEKAHAEEQRDDALRVANEQVVPLLISFNSTVSALLPLLQELVSRREGHERRTGRP